MSDETVDSGNGIDEDVIPIRLPQSTFMQIGPDGAYWLYLTLSQVIALCDSLEDYLSSIDEENPIWH